MYTYKPRTSAEIKADIAELRLALTIAYDDARADMEDDLYSLYEELEEAEAAEQQPVRDKYATTGLDLIRVIKSFGGIPKGWDE